MPSRALSLDQVRRYAIARTFGAPLPLAQALSRLGFLQADPIRAPARAQDLMLRQRVPGYQAGDLDRQYASLPIEEDFFINYGFLPREHHQLMRPRPTRGVWDTKSRRRVRELIAFIEERGIVHPREVEAHFAAGRVTNYWGGTSSATTHLLDAMHYRGILRVARRDRGIRMYAIADRGLPETGAVLDRHAIHRRLDALLDLLLRVYAPIPADTFGPIAARLRYGVPQWRGQLAAAIARARQRTPVATVDGVSYLYPVDDDPWSTEHQTGDAVRLLAPFDPLVWDRRRFERLWGWAYRFEAYTPAAKRKLGYYALPLLYRDRIVGWANVSADAKGLDCRPGFVDRPPRERAFARALDAEVARMTHFVGASRADADSAE